MNNIFTSALNWLIANAAVIGTMFGIFWAIAKGVSNEGAPKAIAVVQKVVDSLAVLVESLGKLLKWLSDFLASVIKSDGLFGRK
jgi:hypothetical protein